MHIKNLDNLEGLFYKDFVVGLDIGTNFLKIAQFKKAEGALQLVKTGFKEIKQTEDTSLRRAQLISALKELFKGIDPKKCKVIAAINCPKTAVKSITVPLMPKAELSEGIRLEAKNYFPFPVEDAFIDFEITGEVTREGIRKYQALIATSPRKTVNEYLSLLGEAGIKPASFIPAPCALKQLAKAYLFDKGKVECLVDIGSSHTELTILKGNDLIFSRKIIIAGNTFTKAMTDVLTSDRGETGLSLEEAEKIKREIGIPAEGETRVIDGNISTLQILSMIRPPLEDLANEIGRSFDYFREAISKDKIDSLVLLGQGAFLRGLGEFLSKELAIEVKVGIPAALQREDSCRQALALGAALSEAKGINLLPPEIKEELKRTFKRTTIESAIVGALLILAFIYTGMKIQLNNFQKRISVARMEYASLRPQLNQLKRESLLAEEPYWEEVFKELSVITPADIYLTELSMENRTLRVRGFAVSVKGEESLSDFIQSMGRGLFKDAKLVTTRDALEKQASQFELICQIN